MLIDRKRFGKYNLLFIIYLFIIIIIFLSPSPLQYGSTFLNPIVHKLLKLADLCRNLRVLLHSKTQPALSFLSLQNLLNPKPVSTIPSPCLEIVEQEEVEERPTATNSNTNVSLQHHPNPEISCFYQKGFSQITREVTGKALHALCIKGLAPLGVLYNNTLVTMYSRFGHVGLARYVFDQMRERTESSWNNMMSGFVRAGFYWESVVFFNEMRDLGIRPSEFVVASLINACDKSGCMSSEGTQVHGFVVKSGLLCDVFVGTSLLHFYGSCDMAFNAEKIFEEMPEKNVVSWTALMVAYLDDGDPSAVMSTYQRMKREGVCCNANTHATVISSCSSLEDESIGHQVLGHAIKLGLETNLSVANSLVSMFGSTGRLKEACCIFDGMNDRDTITWNSRIAANVHNGLFEESLRCFHQMRHVHDQINATTLSTLISGSGSVLNLKFGRGLHCLVMKVGLNSNICVCNTLIDMYSDAGKTEDAELVFHAMAERDIISFNSLINCYAQDGNCLDALKVFSRMLCMVHTAKVPNYVTFTSALAACSDPKFAAEGKILHALVIIKGLHDNLIVGNALLTLYAKCGMMVEAKKVFQTMSKQNEVTWNALICGHVDNEEPDEGIKTFKLMREEDIPAGYITIASVIGACLEPNDLLKHGMPIHAYAIHAGFESDMYVKNSLIKMYAICGDLNAGTCIFNALTDKTASSWNVIIAANALHGHAEDALKLLQEMRHAGVDLDQFSISECLAATAKLAMLEEGQQLHSVAVKLGLDLDHFVRNAATDMYGRCGEIDDVQKIIPHPTGRSQVSWNILISSFSRLGYFEKARETFHEMLQLGVKPNHVTFVSLLSACNHGGLLEEGLAYYHSMLGEFGVPVGIEHCVCVVDLLARAGRFTEAEIFIEEMPVPPTDFVWRSLLAACKIHGNLELGRKAAGKLLKLDSLDDAAYVLYSNICATTGRWEDVENVRKQMESNKIKKKPACSWVKLKDKLCSFGIGDRSHPQTSEIYTKLEELKKMIKEAGYVPDTSYVLHDTDEEQKEHNLWNHSERLALAYGLISTPKSATIKIFKNLRVCGDCHSVYKLVSGILGRQILLRDPYRFHRFTSGKCSCSDYW